MWLQGDGIFDSSFVVRPHRASYTVVPSNLVSKDRSAKSSLGHGALRPALL